MKNAFPTGRFVSALLLCCFSSFGIPVEYRFEGSISKITRFPNDDFIGSFAVGDTITATISTDSSLPDSDPDPTHGLYRQRRGEDPRVFWTLTLGRTTFVDAASTLSTIEIYNGTSDLFDFIGEGTGGSLLRFTLNDPAGKAFKDDELPTRLKESDWLPTTFNFKQSLGTIIEGTIAPVRSVPDLSSSAGLLTLGLFSLVTFRKLSDERLKRFHGRFFFR
jgi:hypothetical protein